MIEVKKGQTMKLNQKETNYEDKVDEDHNEFPGLHLCVGMPSCHYGAGHVHYCAGGR